MSCQNHGKKIWFLTYSLTVHCHKYSKIWSSHSHKYLQMRCNKKIVKGNNSFKKSKEYRYVMKILSQSDHFYFFAIKEIKQYQTKKISDLRMLSSADLKFYHMCGCVGFRGGIRGQGGASWFLALDQKFASLHHRPLPQARIFCIWKPHSLITVHCIILYKFLSSPGWK